MLCRRSPFRLALVLLALVAVSSADAQVGPGRITGRITDPLSGEPLVGVNVTLESTTLGGVTDVNGEFAIRGVPPGTYNLKVSYVGYSTASRPDVPVAEGGLTIVDVRLGEAGVEFNVRQGEHAKPPPPAPPPPPDQQDIPEFPWPPPKSSAMSLVAAGRLRAHRQLHTLADVAKTLEEAMDSCGYAERSYYRVPRGFALVSRIEQIKTDGTPKEGADRWSLKVTPSKVFDLASLFRAIFTANAGHYRIVVFVVTSKSFSESESTVEREDAVRWLHHGMQSLPLSIGNLPFTSRHTCTALIYEFEQATPNHTPEFMDPSNITGRMHLEKSGLWKELTR